MHFLQQIQSDFDRVRWQCQPIQVQLVHRATNAEAEGVIGIPLSRQQPIAFQGAGHRELFQRIDGSGKPLFRDDPIVDVKGHPITNSSGQAFDVVMPAFRTVDFAGGVADYQKLSNVAERAGRLVAKMKNLPSLSVLRGWQFSTPSEVWWAVFFEIAWAGRHPLLTAERRLWLPAEKPTAFVPYDIEQLRALAASGFAPLGPIPENWLKRLPDAFMSEINNAAAASFDATDYLLTELSPASQEVPSIRETHQLKSSGDQSSEVEMKRRFAVALSFSGKHRALVGAVAQALSSALGEPRVFYDEFHKAELASPNLDLRLQGIYKDDSDLIVVFICGEYQEKEWCGLEWRAIRELVKNRSRPDEDVMYLRLDDKPLDGLLTIDGYLDVAEKNPQEIADSIQRRWSAKR